MLDLKGENKYSKHLSLDNKNFQALSDGRLQKKGGREEYEYEQSIQTIYIFMKILLMAM